MILFVLCQIGFVSRASNREQTFQTDRIEGTISIPSVWEKRWKRESHRAASFRGEILTYKNFVQKDVQLSTLDNKKMDCPPSRPPGGKGPFR